jgi:hypothetical protein
LQRSGSNPSKYTPPTDSRLAANAADSSTSFEAHTPPNIQENINLLEADIRVLCRFVSDEEVQEKTQSWIPNTGNTRSHVSHYMRTIELYWHMKLLLGRAMMDRKDDKEETLLQLNKIQAQLWL